MTTAPNPPTNPPVDDAETKLKKLIREAIKEDRDEREAEAAANKPKGLLEQIFGS